MGGSLFTGRDSSCAAPARTKRRTKTRSAGEDDGTYADGIWAGRLSAWCANWLRMHPKIGIYLMPLVPLRYHATSGRPHLIYQSCFLEVNTMRLDGAQGRTTQSEQLQRLAGKWDTRLFHSILWNSEKNVPLNCSEFSSPLTFWKAAPSFG